jgi:hypothetical protein
MSNLTRIIMIWGTAILVYLLVTNASGTSSVLNAFSGFTNTFTTTLQGR